MTINNDIKRNIINCYDTHVKTFLIANENDIFFRYAKTMYVDSLKKFRKAIEDYLNSSNDTHDFIAKIEHFYDYSSEYLECIKVVIEEFFNDLEEKWLR